jgi:hypothetical protein
MGGSLLVRERGSKPALGRRGDPAGRLALCLPSFGRPQGPPLQVVAYRGNGRIIWDSATHWNDSLHSRPKLSGPSQTILRQAVSLHSPPVLAHAQMGVCGYPDCSSSAVMLRRTSSSIERQMWSV